MVWIGRVGKVIYIKTNFIRFDGDLQQKQSPKEVSEKYSNRLITSLWEEDLGSQPTDTGVQGPPWSQEKHTTEKLFAAFVCKCMRNWASMAPENIKEGKLNSLKL